MKPICFQYDIFGKKICIPIYYKRAKFPWEDIFRRFEVGVDPEPQPWKVLDKKELLEINPHLNSFVKNGLLNEKDILDVSCLGLISEAAEQLSPALRERFQGLVNESVAGLNKQDAFMVNIG